MLNLVSKSQLAEQLGVSVRTVNRRIARRELPPPFSIGKFAYWREPTLARWLATREAASARRRR